MLAKRFLYVCAGPCMLALGYHLGVRSAAAQVGGSIEDAAFAWVANFPAAWPLSRRRGRSTTDGAD